VSGRRLLVAVLALAGLACPPAAAAAPRPVAGAVSAPSVIVVEASTGDVALARNPDRRRPIASATKLMTALVTLESTPLARRLSAARYQAAPVESAIGLRAGERLSVRDLLRAVLVASANDAAFTLAERVGGSQRAFVRRMNEQARRLGLRDSHFTTPVGLDSAGNYSTARDLVMLTLRLRSFAFFRRTVDSPRVGLTTGDRPRTLLNRNRLVRSVPWITGVKTGHTQRAGWVLVGSGRRRQISLVSVVLGAVSEAGRERDTLAVLRGGLRLYRRARPLRRGQVLARAQIRFRRGAEVSLAASRTVRRVLRRGQRLRLRVSGAPAELQGPLPAGTRAGSVDVLLGARRIDRVALVTAAPIAQASLGQRAKDRFTGPLALIALGLLALASLEWLRRRADRVRRAANGEVETA